MKNLRFIVLVVAALFSVSYFAYANSKDDGLGKKSAQKIDKKEDRTKGIIGSLVPNMSMPQKEAFLGNILSQLLTQFHYVRRPIDDDLSIKAFDLYLKRLDYGKQFLLQEDVDKLSVFKKEFDDQLKSGNILVVDVSNKLISKRLSVIETFALEAISKPFDFTVKEKYETDPEKRKFVKTEKELKDRWRRLLKYETLVQFLDLKQEREDEGNPEKQKEKAKKKKKGSEPTESLKKLTDKQLEEKAREKVKKRYEKVFKRLGEEKRNDRLDKFYNSITRVFDPHTHYLMPEEKEDFDIDMKGKLQGIGALLREDGSYIKVDRIIPGSASWKGKELEAGDTILAVAQAGEEPVDIVDMSIRDAVKLIRGEKGSIVKLTVKKQNGTTQVISIVRDDVVLEESYVKGAVLTHDNFDFKVGYIHVPKFYRDFDDEKGRNCSDDVKSEVLRFAKNKEIKGIILDLRGNGGGALKDASLMSGLFIKEGPIVQVKGFDGSKEIYKDDSNKVYNDQPLIVLVDRFSASASEIVAAAMQDYGRAVIVGSSAKTHGKGTVQAIMDRLEKRAGPLAQMVGELGALKITIQMFYRITGGSTQFKGVVPDIALPDQFEYFDSGEESLDYAIPYQKVDPVKFTKWPKSFNVDNFKSLSEKRVAKHPKFKKIKDSVAFYKGRKEQTNRSLQIDDMIAFKKENKEKAEKFKLDQEIEAIKVESFFKKRDEVEKERAEEFHKTLRKDPILEETLLIMRDMVSG